MVVKMRAEVLRGDSSMALQKGPNIQIVTILCSFHWGYLVIHAKGGVSRISNLNRITIFKNTLYKEHNNNVNEN